MNNSDNKIDYASLSFDEKVKLINESNEVLKSRLIYNIIVESSESDALKLVEMYKTSIKSRVVVIAPVKKSAKKKIKI